MTDSASDVKLRLGRPALLITAGASLLLSTGVLPGIPAANSVGALYALERCLLSRLLIVSAQGCPRRLRQIRAPGRR